MSTSKVAVLGAGFSGLLTALHLLAREDGPAVALIERGAGFGLGVAYGACGAGHLLNVRAGNMSAFPDRPDHFIDWLRADGGRPEADAAAFASRRTYGFYLQHLLRQAATTERSGGRLDLVTDAAVAVRRAPGGGMEVELGMGRVLAADAVVLALGNPPSPTPRLARDEGLSSRRYIADPWADDVLGAIEPDDRVMLLGTGLTMVDVVIALTDGGHAGPLLAVSRHGLLPRRHGGAPPPPEPPPATGETLSQSLRLFRADCSRRGDWRPALDALRPLTQSLWRRRSPAEQRRFLRHLRAYWDVHRHRLSPVTADQLDHFAACGRLRVAAGRLIELNRTGRGLEACWRPRGGTEAERLPVDWLINCTGPEGDVGRSRDPLIQALIGQGLARPDPLRLGFDVDADSQVVGIDGRADHGLTAVGPITKGAFWETTAVPDIRIQAAEVAAHVSRRLAGARHNI